ncbi:MAG TPA: hypothetical protein VFE02_18980 [Candidatus Acidoferrales bacterium]|jgi:hypothetical protein|nr:hypothetical protein [Candidatus Acidoferrales bacterium]
MSRRGKTLAVIFSVALLTSVAGYATANTMIRRNPATANSGSSLIPLYSMSLVILVSITVVANVVGKQKQLLADGEISMARVTDRVLARNGPNIRYEFITPLGEHFSGSAQDGTRKLSVGMNVPVFYDALNPRHQLALCASFYEVELPGMK